MTMVVTTILWALLLLSRNHLAVLSFSPCSRLNNRKCCNACLRHVIYLRSSNEISDTKVIETDQSSLSRIARERAAQWIDEFSRALSRGDVGAALNLFAVDPTPSSAKVQEGADEVHDSEHQRRNFAPFWRDMIAYTWNIITLEGRDAIRDALEQTIGQDKKNGNLHSTTWKLARSTKETGSETSSFPPPIACTNDNGCEFWCDISTAIGTGRAHVRLNSDNQATTVLTVLMELHDRPFAVGANRKRGLQPVPQFGRSYWSERRQNQWQHQDDDRKPIISDAEDEESYYVAIIGAGQAGLSLGARLELLDIPYVVLEAGPTPGWSWRQNRYPSLHLHDPAWYNHLPYLPFPPSWPIFAPKDKLADFLDMYAKVLDIHIQTNTKVVKAGQERERGHESSNNGDWRIDVTVESDSLLAPSDGLGEAITKLPQTSTLVTSKSSKQKTIRAKHLVFATGNSSHPKIPKVPGMTTFQGTQLHSSQYQGGRVFAGKRVVVIGSNNSAFDIAQDLWEQGAEAVTMLQRSPSLVVSTTSVLQHGLGPLYSEGAKFHHEDADLIATTVPYKILLESRWKQVTEQMKETDAELIRGLQDAGYKFDFGYKGTGLFAKSASEGGGFYINVGCADLMIQGKVQILYATVERFTKEGVVIRLHDTTTDGDCEEDHDELDRKQQVEEYLPADVVVYATGFDTMDAWVDRICGPDVAQKVGKTWGLGLNHNPSKDPGPWEGELRNMWKPTNVDGLWFHGGNLAQARHYSRLLSLQLAARYLHLVQPNGSDEDKASSVYGIPKPVKRNASGA